MSVNIDILEDDVDVIEMNDINNLEISAMGDLFIKYADSNNPQTPEEVFDEPVTDEQIHAYIGFYIGYEMPLPETIPTAFHWCVRDLTSIQNALRELEETKQDKLNGDQLNAVNSGIDVNKVRDYDNHIQDIISNPHHVTKEQVGLGNVANTGDSATPTAGGVEKFTTGGAHTLKSDLERQINDLSGRVDNKQDQLVNQENIKSINGVSILGSGNLDVGFDPQTLNDMLCYDIVDEEE